MTDEFDLDIVGVLEGTDKSSSISFAWDYLQHYQRLFSPWRDKQINFIEIGVERGPSLRVWAKFFTCAQIVGIDINPECKRLVTSRVAIEIGSQEDPGFLHSVCAKYPPTIVIDDGSHLAHHMVYSFKRIFPMLAPGGLYIAEDMEFHSDRFGDRWAGNKTVSASDYFVNLARSRMFARRLDDKVWGDDRYILDHVDEVSMIGGAVVIRKKIERSIPLMLELAERYLKTMEPSPSNYLRLVEYILRHGGPLDAAERAARHAISIGEKSSEAIRWLGEVLFRQGRLDDAAEAAIEATHLWPSDALAWDRLAFVERQRSRLDQAIIALEQAAALNPKSAHFQDQLSGLFQRQGDLERALSFARKAMELNPSHEPLQQHVRELEQLAT